MGSNSQVLTRRIKSAKNIKQITKAMEMVSASKMRRAQAQALGSRAYARKLQSTLRTIAALSDSSAHPLLQLPETGVEVVILVATDRSLAGSLNTNLFRSSLDYLDSQTRTTERQFIVVGQKALQLTGSLGSNVVAQFTHLPDPLSYQDTLPLSKLIMDGFLKGDYSKVQILYMDFVSTLVQQFRVDQLLPIKADEYVDPLDEYGTSEEGLASAASYTFEPNATEILDWLLPYYIEMAVYQILLEAKASEHSARMVAMKNASENATDIIADLQLEFNRGRQAAITGELLDITTASLAATS